MSDYNPYTDPNSPYAQQQQYYDQQQGYNPYSQQPNPYAQQEYNPYSQPSHHQYYPTGPISTEHNENATSNDTLEQSLQLIETRGVSEDVLVQARGLFTKTGPNGEKQLSDSLKKALHHCIDTAISIVGRLNGFLGNNAIKIHLPQEMRSVSETLRGVGLGQYLDEFETSLNRAAEEAAPQARDVFVNSVSSMDMRDVHRLWKGEGSQHAISDYFKARSSTDLVQRFTPIIHKTVDSNRVGKIYAKLKQQASSIPFLGHLLGDVDIHQYTCNRAIDGMFHVLGEQEVKIRDDPAAQVTGLLKLLFHK